MGSSIIHVLPCEGRTCSGSFHLLMKHESETNPFYLTPRWQRKRAAILRRDKYQCQECKRYGRMRDAKEVHHIKHLDDYPELAFDDSNLISLCSACHRKMHPEKGSLRMNYRGDRYFMN